MQSRVSSSLAVLTSLFLFFASDLVVAQVSAPSCTSSIWEWSYNSIGQDPCTIVAYLMATCYDGKFSLEPVLGPTHGYLPVSPNPCDCSTVSFNLLSACSTCQGGTTSSWTLYSENCTITVETSTFPNKVPPQTRVPQWALQDTTIENRWDATEAFTIGDSPEIPPGKKVGPSESGSNTGAIVGGVVGGVVAVAATAGLVFIFRRRRRHARAQLATSVVNNASPPPSASQMTHVPTMPSYGHTSDSLRGSYYDPDNPSTYPEHQGVPTSTSDMNPSVVSHNEHLNGNNIASMQTSRPQGYHGLPMPMV
ncbi:hypothetical protein BJY52DRAFT_356725 [Lactarius psammicola]|nr:hypothetical protein BJY52DRAFT_356725 [Lactarius psammicola]